MIMMIKPQVMFVYVVLLFCFYTTYTCGKTTYPNIDYDTQTPWGNHDVSIYHEEIDNNILVTNDIAFHNAIIGVISRSILLEKLNHHTTTTIISSLKRELGDFDALNELFKGVVIALPDINELNAGTLLGLDLLIWINNMKCFDISVEDVIISHESVGTTEYDLSVEIIDLAISCDLDWRYAYSLFSGEGSAQVYTTKSDAEITLKFNSEDFDIHPPQNVEASQCLTGIEIDRLDLQGGVVASIANLFRGSLTNAIEAAINGVACDELQSLGTQLLGDVLDLVGNFLNELILDNSSPEDHYLYAENHLEVPTEINLVDFSTLGKESGDWFQMMLNFVNDFLSEEVLDQTTFDGTDLRINTILRDLFLDNDRALSIPFEGLVIFDGHDLLTETVIELDRVKVFGLDTIQSFDSLESAGKYTILNHFAWEHLNIELDFTLTIKPSTTNSSIIEQGSVDEFIEQMTISTGINDIDVDFHFLLAVDTNQVGSLEFGSITNTSNILSCLVDTIYQLEVTGFTVNSTSINIPTLDGFISPGIDSIIKNAADAIFKMYEPSLINALPKLFQLSLKNLVNGFLQDFMVQNETQCVKREFPSNNTFVNIGDLLLNAQDAVEVGGTGTSQYGPIIHNVMTVIQTEILGVFLEDGRSYLNDLFISKITEQLSSIPGTLNFPGDYGSQFRMELGELVAYVELKLSNATIQNIDTIGAPMNLVMPISPQDIYNTFAVGVGRPLQTSAVLTFGFNDGDKIMMRNVVGLSMDLGAIANLTARMSIIENNLLKFPIQDMLNLDCWLSLIPAPPLDSKGMRLPNVDPTLALKLGMLFTLIELEGTCITCSSPQLEEFSSPLQLTDLLNNDIINYITNVLGGSFLQVAIDRMLNEAWYKCPHSISYNATYESTNFEELEYQKQEPDQIGLLVAVVGTIVSIIIITFSVRMQFQKFKRRKLKRWAARLTSVELSVLLEHQKQQKDYQRRLNAGQAMIYHPAIPCIMRFMIPVLVIVNIAFFLSGHLSIGASVELKAMLAGENLDINRLFVFSMAESIKDMWDAGAKELAIFILLVSGLWPYTKQLTVLVLWFLPPKVVSVSRRESIFVWLDLLGKWAFVDIFVLILSIASFRTVIKSPNDTSFLPQDFINMDLIVVPQWGLYANMIAQLISQLNSHIIIYYQRRVQSYFEEENAIKMDSQSLRRHKFRESRMKPSTFWSLRPIASMMLLVLCTLFILIIIFGCILPSYSLEQFGLVGLVSSIPYVKHNIFSTMKILLDQANFTGILVDRLGLTVLSTVMILTVLVIPCIQVAMLLIRWFVPLSKRSRLQLFAIIEALSSWQYIEVYLVSIIVASWQLGKVSEFLINGYCGALEDIFAYLQFYGVLGINEAQCFRVSAKLELATWFLIAASILLMLINHMVGSASQHQEEDLKYESLISRVDVVLDSGTFGGENDSSNEKFADSKLLRTKLVPEDTLFTDYYRCLLSKEASVETIP